jgi:hypothetical protein
MGGHTPFTPFNLLHLASELILKAGSELRITTALTTAVQVRFPKPQQPTEAEID